MNTSEAINEIAAALAKAQGAMDKAAKDSTNPHFRSKYADLSSVMDACRKVLADNSIAVVQAPGSDDSGAVVMTTRLVHSSGQWLESSMACKPMKQDAQGMGSVITYLRRYALAAMTGVVADDDDGNAASMSPQSPPQQRQRPNSPQKAPGHSKAVNDALDAAVSDRPPADFCPPDENEPIVDYVNSAGEVDPCGLGVALRKMNAGHRSKLNELDYKALYEANNDWLEKHAPDEARRLWVRGQQFEPAGPNEGDAVAAKVR